MTLSKRNLLIAITIIFSAIFSFYIITRKQSRLSNNENSAFASPLPSPRYFVMLGDTGSGTTAQTEVADLIKRTCEEIGGCEAAFIAGDIIYEKGVESTADKQFQAKFEDPYRELSFPFFIAYGNHDYAGCTECYIKYTNLSKKWNMPAPFYVQNFGPQLDFFVIDTEQFIPDQQTWLKEQLGKSSALYKVVVGHRPIKTFETTKIDENWNGKEELKDIICNEADFYIAGHAHILEDNRQIENCTVKQLVSGGGGASIRTISQKSNGLFAAAKNGFILLKLGVDGLTYTFLTID